MIRSEKLRNKQIESTYQLPYENKLLIDLPDEIWKSFPVLPYDQHYMISNKGRVKRLAHNVIKSNGVTARLQEKIIKQIVGYKFNRSLNEKTYYTTFRLATLNCRKTFMTARIVYCAFVEPFDLENPEWNVRYKDCNGLNCLPDNLYLFERSNLTRWVKDNKRVRGLSSIGKIWQEGVAPVRRPGKQTVGVAKYSLTGDLIDVFPTILAAAHDLGVSRTVVSHRIHGESLNKQYILKAVDISRKPPAKIEVELPEEKLIDLRKYGVPEEKIYPFQHTSLDDLPGEQWEAIPDTDQVFWVSDLGRVKSVDRMIHTSLHGNYLKTGKIIYPVVKHKGRRRPSLTVDFTNRKKKVDYQVTRLVYMAFVGEIPRNHTVIHKDNDPFNCRAENLALYPLAGLKQYFINKAAADL